MNDYQNKQQPAPVTRERRCTDCGALVSDEHIALAKETGQEPYCPDCWGESLVWAEGKELEDLKQWEAYIGHSRDTGKSGHTTAIMVHRSQYKRLQRRLRRDC